MHGLFVLVDFLDVAGLRVARRMGFIFIFEEVLGQ